MLESPPRLAPERPFPPYSFVPGLFPHPISDTAGHSYGQPHPTPIPLHVEHWADNADYLFGIDLFNHGYYWEAHEVWEGLWHACGRAGILGDFLKGLIQMTAAGVKVRQQMPRGVAGLGAGAAELFERVRESLGTTRRFLGLDVEQLLNFARDLAARPDRDAGSQDAPVERVLPLILLPQGDES
jgi:hypothetical protein